MTKIKKTPAKSLFVSLRVIESTSVQSANEELSNGNAEFREGHELCDVVIPIESLHTSDMTEETSLVAAILGAEYLNKLYNNETGSYFSCADTIHTWAAQFVKEYGIIDWEEFEDSGKNKTNAVSWEHLVIEWGHQIFTKYCIAYDITIK